MAATQLSLATPADWIHLDMSAEPLASARQFVDHLTQDEPEVDTRLKLQMAGALQSALRSSRDEGGILAALWSRQVDNQSVGASVIAAAIPLEPAEISGEDGNIDVAKAYLLIAAELAQNGDVEDEASVVLETGTIQLPAGEAVRVRKSQTVETMGRQEQTEVVQYFVLVPDEPVLIVLTFSTPTLELAEPLVELFDAMAGSLRWRS